jgi:WD40 repeat protein
MPDGEQIVVGWKDGRVEVLDASTGQEVVKITEGDDRDNWTFVAVSPNGDRIASARDKEMYIWTRTGEAVAGPLTSSDNEPISGLSPSPQTQMISWPMALGEGDCLRLERLNRCFDCWTKEISFHVTSLALSPSITNGSTTMKTRVAVAHQT